MARELLPLQPMFALTSKFRRLFNRGLLAVACAASSAAVSAAQGAATPDFQPPEQIDAAARAEAQRRLPALSANQRLISGPLDGRLRLTNCPNALRANIPAGAVLRDRAMVEVRCEAGAGWRVFVPVKIAGTRTAVVLKRSVVVGETLQPDDLTTIDADPAQLPLGYFDDPRNVAGLTTSRSMAAGFVLSNQSLKIANSIARGQEVTLLAVADGLNVRVAGRALSDGYLNQRIKVQNSSSGKVVEGIARSDRVVEINSQ